MSCRKIVIASMMHETNTFLSIDVEEIDGAARSAVPDSRTGPAA
jgi:hypothetical protein